MKRIISLLLCLVMLFAFTACKDKDTDTGADGNNGSGSTTKTGYDVRSLPAVVKGSMVFLDIGTVTFEIYPQLAPESALNFIYLVNSGHYNGVIVDRLVKDFVIQAGNYQSGFVPRNTEFEYSIKGEFKENGIENNISFIAGTMAWVYTGTDYNSASKEFAIYTDSTTCWDLNGKYAAFGIVTGKDSKEVLAKINKRKTYAEKPKKEIMIASVTLEPLDLEGFDTTYEFPLPTFIKAAASGEAKAD